MSDNSHLILSLGKMNRTRALDVYFGVYRFSEPSAKIYVSMEDVDHRNRPSILPTKTDSPCLEHVREFLTSKRPMP